MAEPKSGPKRLTNGARSIGRQAHTIPAFASITDQTVAGTGPQVGSGSFADLAIVVARYIDAKVTLGGLAKYFEDFKYLQATSAEHECYTQLLSSSHGESCDSSERHRKEHEIGRDLDSGVGYPPRLVFETSGILYTSVPEASDWCALEHCRKGEYETSDDDPGVYNRVSRSSAVRIRTLTHDVTSNAERLSSDGEDSVVKTHHRDFVEHKD
jgi:hypothetical protein